MYFSRNTLLAAIFSIGTLVATSSFTVAGGGCSSRGYSRSYSHSYSAPSYGHSYPSHSHGYSLPSQSYAQPTYNYQPQVQVHSVAQAEPVQIQQAPVPGIQQPVQQLLSAWCLNNSSSPSCSHNSRCSRKQHCPFSNNNCSHKPFSLFSSQP